MERTDSPIRWQHAQERAMAERLLPTVRPLTATMFAVGSGEHEYRTTATACSCKAGASGDPVCKHRAAVRIHLAQIEQARAAVARLEARGWEATPAEITNAVRAAAWLERHAA